MIKRLAVAVAAAGLLVALTPLAAPVQAAQCEKDVVVFTQYGTKLPDGVTHPTNGSDHLGNPTTDPNSVGCTASPDAEFNTSFLFPGATIIQSRYTAGGAGSYLFDGPAFGHSGTASVVVDIALGTFTQSPKLALSPAALGCTTASFDGRGHAEYCTLTSLQP
ncbi:MAG TPA: hypothetical protein VNE62_06705 [Actinomycetota bacterium]|nr:hypothetical protein [Actinomycetota bacterium]